MSDNSSRIYNWCSRWAIIILLLIMICHLIILARNNNVSIFLFNFETQHHTRKSLHKHSLENNKKKEKTFNSVNEVLNNLPEPILDELMFEINVRKPYKKLSDKFTKHPNPVLKQLVKNVLKERSRTKLMLDQIKEVRKEYGISESNLVKDKKIKRRKRSLETMEQCPNRSPYLLGSIVVKQDDVPELKPGTKEFNSWYKNIQIGGKYHPVECKAQQKVAIIIPYRDREWHLKVLLYYLHPFMQRQQLDYQIFVVEQSPNTPFNRGALMNIGYKEASKVGDFDCFILHDVDLVPEDDRNTYVCSSEKARHLAVAVNKFRFRVPYKSYFGGVTALTKKQMVESNGFANNFYGWGGEDDDLYHRVVELKGFNVTRYPGNIGRYSMLKHDEAKMNQDLETMMDKSNHDKLAINGLSNLKYEKLNEKFEPLYTWYLVKLPPPPPKESIFSWSKLRVSFMDGMNNLVGEVASKISKSVDDMAKHEENDAAQGNMVY